MTADGLPAFVADVRAEVDAALARLDTIDPNALEPELREHFEQVRRGWEALRMMTTDDVLAMHLEACAHAGRELTPDEVRALLGFIPPQ
jgi:hypothetical protein